MLAVFPFFPAPEQALGSWEIPPEELHWGMEGWVKYVLHERHYRDSVDIITFVPVDRHRQKHGKFSTVQQYPTVPTERIYCSTLSQCPRRRVRNGFTLYYIWNECVHIYVTEAPTHPHTCPPTHPHTPSHPPTHTLPPTYAHTQFTCRRTQVLGGMSYITSAVRVPLAASPSTPQPRQRPSWTATQWAAV